MIFALACVRLASPQVSKPAPMTKTIEPCKFASADQLKTLIALGLACKGSSTPIPGRGCYFPIKFYYQQPAGVYNKAVAITISDPRVVSATCPDLKPGGVLKLPTSIEIDAKILYEDGPSQSSGSLRFRSTVVARVAYLRTPNEGVTAANLKEAKVCFKDIEVLQLSIPNVPSPTYGLNENLANKVCFDATDLVKAYLQRGGAL
jgi:hypothetical protein